MRWLSAILMSLLPAIASAQDARPTRAEVDATIDRGIAFHIKDALKWKEEHNCATCHHASLVICSMREARQFGRAVDEKTDDDPQSIALRLVLWNRLGRPIEEWEPLIRRILDRQNADGGWSQTNDMVSDAWASGQTLYALAHAGLKSNEASNEASIVRGQAFLVTTQRADGAWPMTSRPTAPGDPGSTSLIPITGAGSAWAVLGLVRSTSETKPGTAF
jgi:hypothetical protein